MDKHSHSEFSPLLAHGQSRSSSTSSLPQPVRSEDGSPVSINVDGGRGSGGGGSGGGSHDSSMSPPTVSDDANALHVFHGTYGESESYFQQTTQDKVTFGNFFQKMVERAPYYIPIMTWMPAYTLDKLKSDLIAGLTISVMMVPQALSYSRLATVPAQNALITAMVPVLIYTFLGTSRQMSVGPEAVVSILTASAIDGLGGSDILEDRVAYATLLACLVGLSTMLLGLLRLGFLDSVLSRSLIDGFILGSVVVIIGEQIGPLLGVVADKSLSASTFHKIGHALKHLDTANGRAVAYGLCSLATLVVHRLLVQRFPDKKFIRFIPVILLVVVISTIASWLDKSSEHGVNVLGSVDVGFPKPAAPSFNTAQFGNIIGYAMIITVIGFVEATAISKQYSAKYNYMVSANRELVALGAANIVGSFFGAYPCFAALTRSAVNDLAGAKTQATGFVVFGVVALTLGTLLPAFKHLPTATLSAIVCAAALSLIHLDTIKLLIKVRAYQDGFLLLLTFMLTIAVGVETGVVVGMGLSLLLVVRQTTLPRMSLFGVIGQGESEQFAELEEHPQARPVAGLMVIKIEESLHFANTGQLRDLLQRVETLGRMDIHPSAKIQVPPVRGVIFDVREMIQCDASAVQILLEIVGDYKSRGVKVCFVHLRDSSKRIFLQSGLLDLVGSGAIFNNKKDAKMYVEGTLRSYSSYASFQQST